MYGVKHKLFDIQSVNTLSIEDKVCAVYIIIHKNSTKSNDLNTNVTKKVLHSLQFWTFKMLYFKKYL